MINPKQIIRVCNKTGSFFLSFLRKQESRCFDAFEFMFCYTLYIHMSQIAKSFSIG